MTFPPERWAVETEKNTVFKSIIQSRVKIDPRTKGLFRLLQSFIVIHKQLFFNVRKVFKRGMKKLILMFNLFRKNY
jgi:hypothetical protein